MKQIDRIVQVKRFRLIILVMILWIEYSMKLKIRKINDILHLVVIKKIGII